MVGMGVVVPLVLIIHTMDSTISLNWVTSQTYPIQARLWEYALKTLPVTMVLMLKTMGYWSLNILEEEPSDMVLCVSYPHLMET